MKQIKKTILTLVALLAVTTGAWAQEEYESFDLSSGNTNVNGTHFTITGTSGMNSYGLFLSFESVTVTSLNGENITRVEFIIGLGKDKAENITGTPGTNSCTNGNENGSITDINATSVTLSSENTGTTTVSIKQITVYYASAAGSGPKVAWNKTTKTGTFTMPGGNVELEPEYYPQAVLTAVPTAINDVPATTEGAIVNAGTVKNIGETTTAQGTVMYYVSTTALDDAALLALDADAWKADVPTAADLAAGQAYVYYYVRGNDSDTDDENFSDGDILAANVLTVTIAAAPTYAVTFADGTNPDPENPEWTASPNTGLTKDQTVTVTYTGAKKVLGVKAEKKAAAGNSVDLSTLTANYEAQDGDVLTGTLAANVMITIADGATVTLSGAVINGTNTSRWAGLTLAGDGTIILSGENTVKGFYDEYPGIFVPENKTLTIQGDGSLTASSNGWAAGIGGGYEKACGNITIEGGTINAQAGIGSWAAGIGGGYNTSCGNISITGGTVTATGGEYAAGIGSGSSDGYNSSCGNITITDGVTKVTATAGQSAPNSIGVGMGGKCGTVTIGGTIYWDGSAYQNGGNTYLATSPFVYEPSN